MHKCPSKFFYREQIPIQVITFNKQEYRYCGLSNYVICLCRGDAVSSPARVLFRYYLQRNVKFRIAETRPGEDMASPLQMVLSFACKPCHIR